MVLQWKANMVSLPMVEKWLKDTLGNKYKGNQAVGGGLMLNLSSDVSQGELDSVQAYWDGITPSSDEVSNYHPSSWFIAKKSQIATGALSKSWDDMSSLERKVMLKLEVSPLELLGIE